jgi:zinc/manganese transport system substrate-binding protein
MTPSALLILVIIPEIKTCVRVSPGRTNAPDAKRGRDPPTAGRAQIKSQDGNGYHDHRLIYLESIIMFIYCHVALHRVLPGPVRVLTRFEENVPVMSFQHAGHPWRAAIGMALAATVATAVAGCATTPPAQTGAQPTGSNTKINVAAAENFWGSIAAQLGGEHANVTNIINNPDADPHDYEPTPADGRSIAAAQFVITNGVGYDPWAPKLADANPNPQRTVLTVGDLLHLKDGDNPHRWYSPDDVNQVINEITNDYKKIDPADAAFFDQQKQSFETQGLGQYTKLVNDIKTKYAGTPIGASESIVSPLADGLGLKMLTPESFLDAISEGSDPTAADKSTVDDQIKGKQIKVFVFNSQNSTPDVQALTDEAKTAGIPVVTVTETPEPGNASFQDWQTKQLQDLEQALAQATGK